MKIIFMGSPDFAVPALEGIVRAGIDEVIAVYTQPPKPAGRGQKETKTPVHEIALKHSIPIYTPKNFKAESDVEAFENLAADIAVVAAYGLLLPRSILKAPKYGCINIHPSLLPRWRGAAPIHRTIMAGDTQTGVAIMQMDEGLDTGDVIVMQKVDVDPFETTKTLHDKLSKIGADILLKVIYEIRQNGSDICKQKQSVEGVTYANKITKDEAKINWNMKAKEISCLVRGLSPYPAASFEIEGEIIKIIACEFDENHLLYKELPNGTIVDDNMSIKCADGIIKPRIVKRAGKKEMPIEEMLKGFKIQIGLCLA